MLVNKRVWGKGTRSNIVHTNTRWLHNKYSVNITSYIQNFIETGDATKTCSQIFSKSTGSSPLAHRNAKRCIGIKQQPSATSFNVEETIADLPNQLCIGCLCFQVI